MRRWFPSLLRARAQTHTREAEPRLFPILLKRRKITPFTNTPARLIVQNGSVKVNGVDFSEFSVEWKSLKMPHQQCYMLTPVSISPVSVRPCPCFCQLPVLRPLPFNPPPFHMFAFLPSRRGRSERLPDSGAAVVICLQPLRMNAEPPDPPIRAPGGRK